MAKKKTEYTDQELVEMLRERVQSMTLKEAAQEIGVSFQYLSDILRGRKPIVSELVLAYLAPKGSHFEHRDRFVLVKDKGR